MRRSPSTISGAMNAGVPCTTFGFESIVASPDGLLFYDTEIQDLT